MRWADNRGQVAHTHDDVETIGQLGINSKNENGVGELNAIIYWKRSDLRKHIQNTKKPRRTKPCQMVYPKWGNGKAN